MELKHLLEQAIDDIQNLKEYYEQQFLQVKEYVDNHIEKYKYGVLLEKYFFGKIMNIDEDITKKEQEILDKIIEYCNVEMGNEGINEGIVISYKLRNIDNLIDKYEFDPKIATREYVKLMEQPKILNESTLMMLLVRYEDAISGIIKYLILNFPEAYLKEKSITYSELMTLTTDIKEIKKIFMNKEVEEFMRRPLGEWYKNFENKHKISFEFYKDKFDFFKEIYYRRNLVVHNQGVINETYINNVPSNVAENISKGKVIDVDSDYIIRAFETTLFIIYGTFWGLKKVSKDKKSLEQLMFDKAFSHMLNGEWKLSEYVYGLMKDEENQSEADKICNKINYWISIKNQGRRDCIEEDVKKMDVSAMNGKFKVAKYALLDENDRVSEILEEILVSELPACCVEQWPLFIQYRESNEYVQFKNKHKGEFEKMGYQPEYLAAENENLDEEFVETMDRLDC